MKIRVWLSYDLTARGDYENLYYWLDSVKALECGSSMSTFFWSTNEIENIKSEIRQSLKESVNFNKKDRVYLVFKKENGNYTGGFIIGSRKASPWEGYAEEYTEEDEEE